MELKKLFEQALEQSLAGRFASHNSKHARLMYEAMRYALLGAGKRVRPLRVLDIAKQCAPQSDWKRLAMPAALAIEYVHAYSLIHDDLPCMDNDDMRRGKPTIHRRFGEAVAILTGDGLLSDAFAILAGAAIEPARQCAILARAIGSTGMVLGQLDDITSQSKTLDTLRLKTGKLFECAARLGAISVGARPALEEEFARQGAEFGLRFQLADDAADGERYTNKLDTLEPV
jgi:geranylgeranyl pyrophosphate synthase